MSNNNEKDKAAGKNEKDLPGYPHYPKDEDITYAGNNNGAVSLDDEVKDDDNELPANGIVMGTEADLTEEDKKVLDSLDDGRSMNDARDILESTDDDGDPLNENDTLSGLDVPGSELDDEDEKIGEEDEENNYYSLGSDDNDKLEQGE